VGLVPADLGDCRMVAGQKAPPGGGGERMLLVEDTSRAAVCERCPPRECRFRPACPHRPFQPDIGPQDSKTGLICPRCFEPRSCELRDRIGGCPMRFELCGADVTEVAVTAFDVVEVVDVIGHGGGQFDGGGPLAGVE
jgi:hypothetical protein